MRFLLRIKHWQLFAATWGLSFILGIIAFTPEEIIIELFPVMALIFSVGSFGWIWAISIDLHDKLPPNVPLNLKFFKIIFSIPILYSLVITGWITAVIFSNAPTIDLAMGIVIAIILILHLVSMVCIVLGIRFAAKTLKSIELNRHARFNDYLGEFLLIMFSFVGIWILQPRINHLTAK